MGDLLPPKRQAVVERLGRRLEYYRRHRDSVIPRYDLAESGSLDHTRQDTLLLRQRFLESKAAKKVGAKKTNSCLSDARAVKMAAVNSQQQQQMEAPNAADARRNMAHQKLFKRSASEAFGGSPMDPSGGGHGEQPEDSDRLGSSHKNMKDQQNSQDHNNGLTSFSVQIVQQFSSNNNTQAPHSQTIQTNVTVKTLSGNGTGGTTAGIKTSGSPLPPTSDSATPIFKECKQEKVECEFQPQCSMSSSSNGNGAPNVDSLSNFNLLTDQPVDDVINAELIQDLIDDVFTNTSNADLMKEFTFENIGVKEPDESARDNSTQPIAISTDSANAARTGRTNKNAMTSQHHQKTSLTPPQYTSSPSAIGTSATNLFDMQQQQSVTNISPIVHSPLEVIQSPGTGPNPAAQTLKQMAEQHQQQKQQHPHQRAPFGDSRDFFTNPSKSMYSPTSFGMQQQSMYTNSSTEPANDNEAQNRKVMQLQQQLQRITEQKSPPPGYGSTKPLSHYADMPPQSSNTTTVASAGINVQQQQHMSVATGQFRRAPRGGGGSGGGGVAGANAPPQQQQQQQYMGAGSPSNASNSAAATNGIQMSQSQHFSQTNQQIQATQRQQIQIQDIKPQQQQLFNFQQQQQVATARQTSNRMHQMSQSQSATFSSYNSMMAQSPSSTNPAAINNIPFRKMDQSPAIRGANMKQMTRMKLAQMQRQQQQMMQQQQPRRPPPPDYKTQRPSAPSSMMVPSPQQQQQQQQNVHFPPQVMQMQRPAYQRQSMMNQTRPMVRNEQMSQTTYLRAAGQHQAPNISGPTDSMNKSQEWHQIVMPPQQQQPSQPPQQRFQNAVRTSYMGGFPANNNSIMVPSMGQVQVVGGGPPPPSGYLHHLPQQPAGIVDQQQQQQQQPPPQGQSMLNVEMSSSISLATGGYSTPPVVKTAATNASSTAGIANEVFNLDFLDIDSNAASDLLNIDQVMEMIS